MNSYTDIDGVPAAADPALFSTLLRDHLGFTMFSTDAQNRLETDLSAVAADGLTTADLILRAEASLFAAKVILPARTTLERLVAAMGGTAGPEAEQPSGLLPE